MKNDIEKALIGVSQISGPSHPFFELNGVRFNYRTIGIIGADEERVRRWMVESLRTLADWCRGHDASIIWRMRPLFEKRGCDWLAYARLVTSVPPPENLWKQIGLHPEGEPFDRI